MHLSLLETNICQFSDRAQIWIEEVLDNLFKDFTSHTGVDIEEIQGIKQIVESIKAEKVKKVKLRI